MEIISAFQAIDQTEHKLYSDIDDLLKQNNAEAFESAKELYQEIIQYQEQHTNLTDELYRAKQSIWVYQTNPDPNIVPLRNSIAFLTRQFYTFIDSILNLKSIEENDRKYMRSFVLKIMSRPAGQRLIVKLNRQNKTLLFRYAENDNLSVSCDDRHVSLGRCTLDEKKQPVQNHREAQYKGIKKNQGVSKVILHYVNNYHRRPCSVTLTDNGHLIFMPSAITFAHELLHALHWMRGVERRQLNFHASRLLPGFWLYARGNLGSDPEEYWTIEAEQAKLSENVLRQEHGLPKRRTHLGGTLDDFPARPLATSLLQTRAENKELDNVMLTQLVKVCSGR